jgi:hypothetical protein
MNTTIDQSTIQQSETQMVPMRRGRRPHANKIKKQDKTKKTCKNKGNKLNQKIAKMQELLKLHTDDLKKEKIQKRLDNLIDRSVTRALDSLHVTDEENANINLTREERRQKRKEHKKQHKDKKQLKTKRKEQRKKGRSKQSSDSFDLEEQGWPSQITHLYLDGNNMLFVPKSLRELTLTGNRGDSEQLLSDMAREFSTRQQLAFVNVMYDSTVNTLSSDTFVVSSARPTKQTTDDALVEIAKQGVSDLDCTLFVTSDRELRFRLKQAGAKVIKPKQWFKCAFDKINVGREHPFENIDQMLKDLA